VEFDGDALRGPVRLDAEFDRGPVALDRRRRGSPVGDGDAGGRRRVRVRDARVAERRQVQVDREARVRVDVAEDEPDALGRVRPTDDEVPRARHLAEVDVAGRCVGGGGPGRGRTRVPDRRRGTGHERSDRDGHGERDRAGGSRTERLVRRLPP
jgi:hypothetical protein